MGFGGHNGDYFKEDHDNAMMPKTVVCNRCYDYIINCRCGIDMTLLLKKSEGKVTQPMLKDTELIAKKCDEIKAMLIQKNESYGSSVFDPVNVFSKVNAIEKINVRIDDKLARLKNGKEYPGDDTVLDLIGYLIIMLVAKDKLDPQNEQS